MLSKIFIKNFSAHRNNYMVYIASSASAVMVYFILFFLVNNPVLGNKIDNWKLSYSNITDLINAVLLVFEWVFVAYVSGMFIKDRKKKFNLYRFLGISKYRIAIGVFVETIFIQFIAWIVGFVLAVILSKLFGMILIKAMGLNIDFIFFLNFKIIISIIRTFLIFVISLSVVNLIRTARIKNKLRHTRNWKIIRYVLGIIGAALIIYGFMQAFQYQGVLTRLNTMSSTSQTAYAYDNYLYAYLPFKIFIEVVVGTYFVYVGFLEIIITAFGKISFVKYDGFKNITSKLFNKSVRGNVSSLWMITIMSGLAIVMFFGAVILLQSTKDSDIALYPYDLAISEGQVNSAKKILADNNSRIKNSKVLTVKQVVGKSNDGLEDILSFISYSDYQNTITEDGRKYNDEIKSNQSMFLSGINGILLDLPSDNKGINIKIPKLKKHITHSGRALPMSSEMYFSDVVVLPDKEFAKISNENQTKIYGLNYTHAHSKKLNKQLNKLYQITGGEEAAIKGQSIISIAQSELTESSTKGLEYSSYKANYQISATTSSRNKQTRGFVIFLLSIISVIFVIALESILSIKQFSENVRNKQMYQTLKDLGIGRDNINKLVFRQTALMFYLPMVLALIEAIVAANYLIKIANNSYWQMFGVILILYVFFYSILFFITEKISEIQVNKMIK